MSLDKTQRFQLIKETAPHVRKGTYNGLVEWLDYVFSVAPYQVSPSARGLFNTIEDAAIAGMNDSPPESWIPIVLDPREYHEVDYDFPATHKWIIASVVQSLDIYETFTPIVGRIGLPYHNSATFRPYFRLSGVGLGIDQVSQPLVFEVRNSWRVMLNRVFQRGTFYKFYTQAGLGGTIFSSLDTQWNDGVFIEYMNPALAYPDTLLLIVEKGHLMAGDPGADMLFDGEISAEFYNMKFFGVGLSGPGGIAGKAPGCTGQIVFRNCEFPITFIGNYKLFGANMAGVTVRWEGLNSFFSRWGDGVTDFGGIGTNVFAPVHISANYPANPPVGTRTRRVGGTEKEEFWDGVAWV